MARWLVGIVWLFGLDSDDAVVICSSATPYVMPRRLVYFKPAARCCVLHPHFSELPVTCWATRLGDWHPRRTEMSCSRSSRVPGVAEEYLADALALVTTIGWLQRRSYASS